MSSILVLIVVIALSAVVAGAIGSLLGLGGGVVMVPVLTLALRIPIQYAIGASIISVIATSSGSAATYVREKLTNLRVGMLLEIATTLGAISGAYLATVLFGNVLYIIFAAVLLYSLYPVLTRMLRDRARPAQGQTAPRMETVVSSDALAQRFALDGNYYDPASGQQVAYGVRNLPAGFGIMYGAGIASALLGIGGGVFKVLALDSAMGMPIKASTATSNFMIGATAAASAGIYFLRGDINPVIAAPVALGVLAGSLVGTRLLARLMSGEVRLVFAVVMALVAVQMLLRGFGVPL
jgi:uncharacterized membrane protein YfcA